jgi:SAM-dependent methyltransferase
MLFVESPLGGSNPSATAKEQCVMHRTELINHYLNKTSTKNYLEIGLWFGDTFRAVSASIKDSVDPAIDKEAVYKMGSDEFFSDIAPTLSYKYDVIFIDGLHHTDQVDRDIENSLKFLNEGGVIVLHDCNPISEMRQRVPADFDIWAFGWNGDVWKSIFKFRLNNSHLNYDVFVIDSDEGLGVIIPNKTGKELTLPMPDVLDYDFFQPNSREILNLISPNEFYSNKSI